MTRMRSRGPMIKSPSGITAAGQQHEYPSASAAHVETLLPVRGGERKSRRRRRTRSSSSWTCPTAASLSGMVHQSLQNNRHSTGTVLALGVGLVTTFLLLLYVLHQSSSSERLSAVALVDVFISQLHHRPAIYAFDHSRDTNDTSKPVVQLSQEALDMCTRTLWHTLESTTIVLPDDETFVHTGDIDDLWLRDSAAQVHPYLVPVVVDGEADWSQSLMHQDARLDRIVAGLIKRTATYIRHDPYANAFRIDDSYVFSEAQKRLGRHDLISTWNYELDSACYTLRLLYYYYKASADPLTVLQLPAVQEAVTIMVDVWKAEQQHELDQYATGPLLDCLNCHEPYRYPGLDRNGKGTPTNATSGLTWSGFRPSDDACQYGFLVPSNMFAVVALQYVVELATDVWHNPGLALKAQQLAAEIDQGIQEHAIVEHPEFGRIYAYEVDGLGNSLLMDDANVPSLLSIPYLGYPFDPEVYANTRRFIFSPSNPTYEQGTNRMTGPIEGYGSPHMQARIKHNIWPMSIAMQGLTSDSLEERARLVELLVAASGGTGWMHESLDVTSPARYTRAWFCWADALFAELARSVDDVGCPNNGYHVLAWRDPVHVAGGDWAQDA